jgi:hypothetical protein
MFNIFIFTERPNKRVKYLQVNNVILKLIVIFSQVHIKYILCVKIHFAEYFLKLSYRIKNKALISQVDKCNRWKIKIIV